MASSLSSSSSSRTLAPLLAVLDACEALEQCDKWLCTPGNMEAAITFTQFLRTMHTTLVTFFRPHGTLRSHLVVAEFTEAVMERLKAAGRNVLLPGECGIYCDNGNYYQLVVPLDTPENKIYFAIDEVAKYGSVKVSVCAGADVNTPWPPLDRPVITRTWLEATLVDRYRLALLPDKTPTTVFDHWYHAIKIPEDVIPRGAWHLESWKTLSGRQFCRQLCQDILRLPSPLPLVCSPLANPSFSMYLKLAGLEEAMIKPLDEAASIFFARPFHPPADASVPAKPPIRYGFGVTNAEEAVCIECFRRPPALVFQCGHCVLCIPCFLRFRVEALVRNVHQNGQIYCPTQECYGEAGVIFPSQFVNDQLRRSHPVFLHDSTMCIRCNIRTPGPSYRLCGHWVLCDTCHATEWKDHVVGHRRPCPMAGCLTLHVRDPAPDVTSSSSFGKGKQKEL